MMKLSLLRTATGKEDPELPLLQRTNSIELPASEIAAQINASEFKKQTHLYINCSEETVNQAFMVKLLQKDTNKKKRLAWDKKREQWTLNLWKSVLWSKSKIGDFWIQPSCLCETQCG
jgi:hypothetical protein